MSELLDALIKQRRQDAIAYEEYLRRIVELTKQAKNPAMARHILQSTTPVCERCTITWTKSKRWRCQYIERMSKAQDGWRGNRFKLAGVRKCDQSGVSDDALVDRVLELVKNQNEY